MSVSDKSIELKIVSKVTNGGLTTEYISFQEIEASEIKQLTLKNKKVIASSFVAGFFLGGITGLIIGKEKQNDSESMDPQVPCFCPDYLVKDTDPVVTGVVGGIMIGSVAGAIMGTHWELKPLKLMVMKLFSFELRNHFIELKIKNPLRTKQIEFYSRNDYFF